MTYQEQVWAGEFGREWTNRNSPTLDSYSRNYGVSRVKMNEEFLSGQPVDGVLEVGCNQGSQLVFLQKYLKLKHLYGIDIMPYAVNLAKLLTANINIIGASALDIPFKDGYFDLVFTSGTLIHFHEDDLPRAMAEIYRCSRRFIWGFEYYSEKRQEINNYRGQANFIWKEDFCRRYMELFPDLRLVREKKYTYQDGSGNVDQMFLLEKG